jgi:hypothetical protein
MNQSLRVFATVLAGLIANPCAAAGEAQATGHSPQHTPTLQAKWQPIELRFSYAGMTTYYSCDALEDKLARLFKSIGAHPKSQVDVNGCMSNGPSRHAFAHFIGAVPVPADYSAPAADPKSTSASKQALLKRLGVQPSFETDEFPAQRTEVDLARLSAATLEPGDCELLELLGREVLPKLGTTQVRDRPTCFPGRVPPSTPSLKLEVLIATASADAAPAVESKPR